MDGMNKFELYRKSFETLRAISQAHSVVIITATQPRTRPGRIRHDPALDAPRDFIVIDYLDKLGN